eukprot:gene7242-11560_t
MGLQNLSEIVSFNISGQIFQTFSSTLIKNDSLLSNLLLEKIETSKFKDKEGNYFFQRSPEGFEYILNSLRQNKYNIQLKKTSEKKIKFYKEEINFYGLEKVIKINEIEENKETKILKSGHFKKRKRGQKSKSKNIQIQSKKPNVNIAPPRPIPVNLTTNNTNPNVFRNNWKLFKNFMLGYYSYSLFLFAFHLYLIDYDKISINTSIIPLGLLSMGFIWIFLYRCSIQLLDSLPTFKFEIDYILLPLSFLFYLFVLDTETKIKNVYLGINDLSKSYIYHFWEYSLVFICGGSIMITFNEAYIGYKLNQFKEYFLKDKLIFCIIPIHFFYFCSNIFIDSGIYYAHKKALVSLIIHMILIVNVLKKKYSSFEMTRSILLNQYFSIVPEFCIWIAFLCYEKGK